MIHRVFHRANLGLIGTSIRHSLSPQIHHIWGEKHNIPLHYGLYDIPLVALKETLETFQESGGKGMNVTMPFKEDVIPFITHLDPLYLQIKAVNTLVFQDGKAYGHNTDYLALKHLFKEKGLDSSSSVMIFGAGGAARAACEALLSLDIKNITLITRSPEKTAATLLTNVSSAVIQSWPKTPSLDSSVDMIINASPVGMQGNADQHLPLKNFEKHTCFFDMVYSPYWTPFLSLGHHHRQPLLFGIDMLLSQAREAFFLWFGVHPEKESHLRERLLKSL